MDEIVDSLRTLRYSLREWATLRHAHDPHYYYFHDKCPPFFAKGSAARGIHWRSDSPAILGEDGRASVISN